IDPKDFVAINIWAGLERTLFLKLLYRYGFFLLDALILVFAMISGLPTGFYVLLVLLALFPLSLRLIVVRKAKKTFSTNKIFQEHMITMTINQLGIEESFFTHRYNNRWEELIVITELRDIFVIMVENSRVLYIPKNVFSTESLDDFKTLVRASLPDKKINFKASRTA
ncbi:MAG TPA: YcxB family protein, partial [Bacillota bacterium]|nr:YcxB family protein [Bacillota bacterium]